MFRSEQGVIPGSEPQNYDVILRKQKDFSQCNMYQISDKKIRRIEQTNRICPQILKVKILFDIQLW
jgi:hypothetical protein